MKIGILTYHRSHNYGALLQATALRYVLQKKNHEVFYVDYCTDYHKRMYKIFSWSSFFKLSFWGKLKYLFNFFRYFRVRTKRYNNFCRYINTYISPFCRPITDDFDVLIYGSDQIWRKQFDSDQFCPVFFGVNDFKSKLHLSYAASMGIIELDKFEKNKLKFLVSHLNYISVREQSLKQLLESIGISNVSCVLDPTFLVSRVDWDTIIPSNNIIHKSYVLLYELQLNTFNIEAIQSFANQMGLELIVVKGVADGKCSYNNRLTAGPDEFINLIRNAKFVFTSSFHGLVFSIIFHKEFYCSFQKNANRAESILSMLMIRDRIIPPNSNILIHSSTIDYDVVDSLITNEVNKSLHFLFSSIG